MSTNARAPAAARDRHHAGHHLGVLCLLVTLLGCAPGQPTNNAAVTGAVGQPDASLADDDAPPAVALDTAGASGSDADHVHDAGSARVDDPSRLPSCALDQIPLPAGATNGDYCPRGFPFPDPQYPGPVWDDTQPWADVPSWQPPLELSGEPTLSIEFGDRHDPMAFEYTWDWSDNPWRPWTPCSWLPLYFGASAGVFVETNIRVMLPAPAATDAPRKFLLHARLRAADGVLAASKQPIVWLEPVTGDTGNVWGNLESTRLDIASPINVYASIPSSKQADELCNRGLRLDVVVRDVETGAWGQTSHWLRLFVAHDG